MLAYLDALQAAEVVELLPDGMRSEILMRVASLNDVQQSALAEIENLIAPFPTFWCDKTNHY